MHFLMLLHFIGRHQVLINIKIEVKERQHYQQLTHVVKMFIRYIVLQLIGPSKNIHGHHNATRPNQKSPRDKISPEVCTVPTRAIGSRKQPRSNGMDGQGNGDDLNYEDLYRSSLDRFLFRLILPKRTEKGINPDRP